MSTKSSIALGKEFHLYRDVIDNGIYLNVWATGKLSVDNIELDFTLKLTEDDLESLRQGLLGTL